MTQRDWRAKYAKYRFPDGTWKPDAAPWGRIGDLRIGYDVPLVPGRAGSDDSKFDSELEFESEIEEHISKVVSTYTLCLGDVESDFEGLLGDDFAVVMTEGGQASFEIC